MRSSALQPWKWQLTGTGYSTAAQASGAHCPRNDFRLALIQPDVRSPSQPR